MRRQSGTSDLRVLLYMDEVAGYLPPTANPPTKAPLLLLLKQARAFGVGVVLSTQNPVDLDYKALSNAGTWMIGRLQTEQDKARLVDGLTSAAGTVDTSVASDTISGLAKREFLMKRASRDTVEVFTTRWAMSYLRGPLTRDQVATLNARSGAADATGPAVPRHPSRWTPHLLAAWRTGPRAPPVDPQPAAAASDPWPTTRPRSPPASPPASPCTTSTRPPPGQPVSAPCRAIGSPPGSIARVDLRFDEAKADLIHDQVYEAVLFPITAAPSAADFVAVDYDDRDLLSDAPPGAVYRLAPSGLDTKDVVDRAADDLSDHLYRTMSVTVPANTDTQALRPGRRGRSSSPPGAGGQPTQAGGPADRRADAPSTRGRSRPSSDGSTPPSARSPGRRAERTSTMATDLIGGLFGRSSIGASARRMGSAQSQLEAARDRGRRPRSGAGRPPGRARGRDCRDPRGLGRSRPRTSAPWRCRWTSPTSMSAISAWCGSPSGPDRLPAGPAPGSTPRLTIASLRWRTPPYGRLPCRRRNGARRAGVGSERTTWNATQRP